MDAVYRPICGSSKLTRWFLLSTLEQLMLDKVENDKKDLKWTKEYNRHVYA